MGQGFKPDSITPPLIPKRRETRKWVIVVAVVGAVILGSIPVCLRAFVVQPFRAATNTMAPTIRGATKLADGRTQSADRFFVDKLSYRFRSPRRCEIVVFHTDDISGIRISSQARYFVMRIVGLPGERVSIKPPYLCINGERVTDPPIFETIAHAEKGYFGYVLPHTFPAPQYLGSETDSVQLGEDEYFVLGDNSRSSLDSRFWGPLRRHNIVGRVTKIYWPVDRMGIAPE
jgi:signal peptidase I